MRSAVALGVVASAMCPSRAQFASTLARLTPRARQRLCRSLAARLRMTQAASDTAARIAAVRCLVGLLPTSAATIRRLLRSTTPRHMYEVHFTLFCYLDEAADVDRDFGAEVPPLAATYLSSIDRETACAAWMAGDLLGDHFPPSLSEPLLRRLVFSARYTAGRLGALHGVEQLLCRVTRRRRASLIRDLGAVARRDRSGRVRTLARALLRQLRGRS
jgi:hypothetical protein